MHRALILALVCGCSDPAPPGQPAPTGSELPDVHPDSDVPDSDAPDSALADSSDAEDAGPIGKAQGEPCTASEECQSKACITYQPHGAFCETRCDVPKWPSSSCAPTVTVEGEAATTSVIDTWAGPGCRYVGLDLCPCSSHEFCESAICPATPFEQVCAPQPFCITQCPSGWSCQLAPVLEGDPITYCEYSALRVLCQPCEVDADCSREDGWNDPSYHCADHGTGARFCTGACGEACPPPFVCGETEAGDAVCLDPLGTCDYDLSLLPPPL